MPSGGTEVWHPCRKTAQVTKVCHWSSFAWLSALNHVDAECVTSDTKSCARGDSYPSMRQIYLNYVFDSI